MSKVANLQVLDDAPQLELNEPVFAVDPRLLGRAESGSLTESDVFDLVNALWGCQNIRPKGERQVLQSQ